MEWFPLWEILIKKKIEQLPEYQFKYTYGGNMSGYGDVYTTVLFQDIIASYVIDFGAENYEWGTKFSPEYLIKHKKALSEVLLFNQGKLCDDEIFEILAFNEYNKVPFSILNKIGVRHCSSAPAQFNYEVNPINGHCVMQDKEYYLDGDEYTKEEWKLRKRYLKIDKIKQTLGKIL